METLHFPSKPLPDPCAGCGTLLCAECARHGLTAVHFSPGGLCAFGHRLEVPLKDRLTEWIKAEGVTGNYPPDGIAARVVAQVHASHIEKWLRGNPGYLRDLCERIKDEADLTDAERAAENYWHGHDPLLTEDELSIDITTRPTAKAAAVRQRADIIAALTPNDVKAMPGDVVTDIILDALSRGQLCSLLRFLVGYEPTGFALAVRCMVDPEQLATEIVAAEPEPDPEPELPDVWVPLAEGACGDGITEDGEGLACGVPTGHRHRHEREDKFGGRAHWPNLADPETGREPQPERPLEAADIAWDRTHPDPYRNWRNGEQPASDAS